MTIATNKTLTLEEYLTYDAGTEARYELVNGAMVALPTESLINKTIVMFSDVGALPCGWPFRYGCQFTTFAMSGGQTGKLLLSMIDVIS